MVRVLRGSVVPIGLVSAVALSAFPVVSHSESFTVQPGGDGGVLGHGKNDSGQLGNLTDVCTGSGCVANCWVEVHIWSDEWSSVPVSQAGGGCGDGEDEVERGNLEPAPGTVCCPGEGDLGGAGAEAPDDPGAADEGEAGDDSESDLEPEPLTGITAVEQGQRHALGIGTGGEIWAWGRGAQGQLGHGGNQSYRAAIPVDDLPGSAVDAEVSMHSNLVRLDNGELWAFGQNAGGELGLGHTVQAYSPEQVSIPNPVVDYGLAGNVGIAVDDGGTPWGFGVNATGQVSMYGEDYWEVPEPSEVVTVTHFSREVETEFNQFQQVHMVACPVYGVDSVSVPERSDEPVVAQGESGTWRWGGLTSFGQFHTGTGGWQTIEVIVDWDTSDGGCHPITEDFHLEVGNVPTPILERYVRANFEAPPCGVGAGMGAGAPDQGSASDGDESLCESIRTSTFGGALNIHVNQGRIPPVFSPDGPMGAEYERIR